jgi:uncharacterized protein (TIGR01619 family)
MREFFIREENGDKIAIEVDLNSYGYSDRFSWLLSVFIKFDANDTSSDDFEEYLEFKESLIIELEHANKAKYVGSRVVDGWSELYFYVQDSKGLQQIVSKVLSKSKYMFESNVVKDSKWDFHYKNLSPNELEIALIESEKIIFLLKEEGDDLLAPRVVEHYVSFETPTQKDRFLKNLSLDGFVYKDDISSDEFENGVALTKEHNVVYENIELIVKELFEELKKSQGYYEGWSTTLSEDVDV